MTKALGLVEMHVWRPGCTSAKKEITIASRIYGSVGSVAPSAVDKRIVSMTYVVVVTIAIAMTQGLGYAQSSFGQRETPLPSSISAHQRADDSVTQHARLHQQVSSPCSLRVPDTILQSSARPSAVAEGASVPSIYVPLSGGCKLNLFLKQTYSPYTFASAGFSATWAQAMGQWPHYGGGMQGWAKRFGATLADTESRRFIQSFALSTILHQDPRYFPSHKRTLISRSWYAATRVLITKNDNGDSAFNTSEFLGALFASSLQNAYYPRHDRTFGETMNRFGGALSSDAAGDLLREFMPDIKRFFQKHAPKKIRRLEQKLPVPPEDKLWPDANRR